MFADFGCILLNSCFTQQFSMPDSEYSNKCDTRYFEVCQAKNPQKLNMQKSKERKFEEKVTEKGWVVLIFIYLYSHFCHN